MLTRIIILLSLFGMLALSGCSGVTTFPNTARAGDTVVLAAGWKHTFSRDTVTVTITPSVGNPVTYLPGDPAIRSVFNLYPDPLASINVSPPTGQDLTPYASTYAGQINNIYTNGDNDWWQTFVFVDLPQALLPGAVVVDISSPSGETASSTLNIIDGVGSSDPFMAELNGSLTSVQLSSLERVDHYELNLTGNSVPYAVQLELSHSPDVASGGVGKAYVVNPRGDIKSVTWSDDGTNLTILIMPAHGQNFASLTDFKVYVAGGVQSLLINGVQAFDSAGNLLGGIDASLTASQL